MDIWRHQKGEDRRFVSRLKSIESGPIISEELVVVASCEHISFFPEKLVPGCVDFVCAGVSLNSSTELGSFFFVHQGLFFVRTFGPVGTKFRGAKIN